MKDRPFKDIGDILNALNKFVHKANINPNEGCYRHIDALMIEIDRAKSKLGLPVVNKEYFQADLNAFQAMRQYSNKVSWLNLSTVIA